MGVTRWCVVQTTRSSSERTDDAVVSPIVLLVEDDACVLDVVSRMLRLEGLTVLEARDPQTALEHALRADPALDLLLTDIVMPGMSGLDLARRVRAAHPGIGCVFMSGYAGESFADELLSDPSCHFIKKPFRISVLMRIIGDAIGAGRQHRAAATQRRNGSRGLLAGH